MQQRRMSGVTRMYEKLKTLKDKLQKMKNQQSQQADRPDVSFFSVLKKTETGPDLVVQRIPGSRYGWSYCRWSNPIRKNNQHVFIIRYVGHEYLHWPELCHVRKDHRILPEKCSVLAETDAPVKRIFHHGSQGRQPSDHPKRRKRKLLLHIRRQG